MAWVLGAAGFRIDLEPSQADYDGTFPAVPFRAPNPERPATLDAAPVAAGWQLLTRDNGPDGFYLACLHKRKAADDNKVTDQRS